MTKVPRWLFLVVPALLSAGLLAGCWKRGVAEFEVDRVTLTPSLEEGGMIVEAALSVTPHFGATIDRVDLDVALAGVATPVTWVGLEPGTRLHAGKPSVVTAKAVLGPLDLLRVGVSAYQSSGRVDIEGSLRVKVAGVPWTVPIDVHCDVSQTSGKL